MLFGILQILAAPAAAFFVSPGAEILIRVIGVSLVLRGFLNIGTVYFRRELEFDKHFAYEFSGRVADFIVALIAGVLLRNAWVLVLAYVSADLVRVIARYIIHPYRPRFQIRMKKVRELFDFGKWILGAAAVVFFINRGDKALVGRILGAAMLGFYEMAFKISTRSASEFAVVISEVTMPAYSKIQDKTARLRQAYLRVLQLTAFFSVPLAGLIVLFAPELTRALLGGKWLPAVPTMRALAIGGALRSIIATAGPVHMAVGKPRMITKFQLAQLLAMAALIHPLTLRWGIHGTAAAVTIGALPPLVLFRRGVLKMMDCPAGRPSALLGFPAGASVGAGILVTGLKSLGAISGISTTGFAVSAGTYAAADLGITYFLGRFWDYHPGPLLRQMLNTLRSK